MKHQIIKSIYAGMGRPSHRSPADSAVSSYIDDLIKKQIESMKG